MAWETRSGREYFYRSVRQTDGTVMKRYFGNGADAELEARRMRDEAEQKRRDRETVEDFGRTVSAADEALEKLDQQARLLLEATLISAGYHRHRSEWRKRKCPGRPRRKTT